MKTIEKTNGRAKSTPALSGYSNGAAETLESGIPYIVEVTLEGSSDMLFHRYDCESVDAKSKAAKGSKSKKSDDTESYIYRNDDGYICLPGEYLRMSIIGAAKFKQDPRSPRKSAMDIYKAGLVALTPLAPIYASGESKPAKAWDYLDRRRVAVQRSAISRARPAFLKGWRATVQIEVLLPEYIPQDALLEVLSQAGRVVGLADFRPTFGRFAVVEYRVLKL